MFKVNRKIEYALMSLKHMSMKDKEELTSAKEICSAYETPFDPTSRVLQLMTQKNILQAEQGAHGGYKIIEDLTRMSLKELSEMLIGPIEITTCVQGDYSQCAISEKCRIIEPMSTLNEQVINFFNGIMVGDLIKSKLNFKNDEILLREKGDGE